jgi:type III restriction enzyme
MATEFRLRKYQEDARDAISNDCIRHLKDKETDERIFCLQAPTGAGKTAIVAKSIQRISEEMGGAIAFVWLSIGDGGLTNQSKTALTKHLNRTGINVYSLGEALHTCPTNMQKSVVVIGWESLNKEDKNGNPLNTAMKDSEKTNFLQMCEETKKHVPIILVIDESHTHADTEKSKKIRRSIIAPTYTILASATPTSNGDQIYKITYKEVARAGMIKKSIVTQEFSTYKDGVISAAEKLQEMIAIAKDTTVPFSPKMLIFIPNADKNGNNGEVNDILTILKDKFSWDEDNGSIKLWFSGENKSNNIEDCKNNLDLTRVIITKEAVDTGVDIPSIQVIVHLRPNKNPRVQVQRIGRGLRMPEQKHYQNKLDTLYFYTFTGFEEYIDWTDAEFLKEELTKSEIIVRQCFVDNLKKFPALVGKYAERAISFIDGEEDDFVTSFYPIFREKIKDPLHKLEKVAAYTQKLETSEMKLDEKKIEKIESKDHTATNDDIAIIYFHTMKEELKHAVKHLPIIEDVIDEVYDLTGTNLREDRQTLILHNREMVCRLINATIRECELSRGEKKTVEFLFDSPPNTYCFNGVVDDPYAGKNFLYDKYYSDRAAKKSDLEKNFEEYLVNHPRVLWWNRNYDRAEGSFSVIYTKIEDGTLGNFYPDNIIELTDGRIFIVDSKGDKSDPNETTKREALIKSLKGTGISGGIVKQRDGNFYIDSGNGEQSLDDIFEPIKLAV